MKKELQQNLFAACPLFYRYQDKGERKTKLHNLMELGMCCGDGWYQLLLDVSMKIETVAEQMKLQGVQENCLPVAVWVREKYGELCIHVDNETSDINELLEKAEALSATTCEVCGSEGKMRQRGWFSCLCDRCVNAHPQGLGIDD